MPVSQREEISIVKNFVKLKRPPNIAEDIKRRADVLAELIVHGPLPPNKWLMPSEPESAWRRMVVRLRAGVMPSPVPALSADRFAHILEEQLKYREFVRTVGNELDALQILFNAEYKNGLIPEMRKLGLYPDPEDPYIPLRETLEIEREVIREERAEMIRMRRPRPRRKKKRA